MAWNAAESFLWGFNNYQFLRHKDKNEIHIPYPFLLLVFKILRSRSHSEFQDWKMRTRDKNQIFNLCFKKFLKIKIFEIKREKRFWPLKSGKIYIEGKNDIQNSKAKLSTNDNHSHLVNVRQVSPPYPLASRLRLTGSASLSLSLCFPSLLEYSINQGLT